MVKPCGSTGNSLVSNENDWKLLVFKTMEKCTKWISEQRAKTYTLNPNETQRPVDFYYKVRKCPDWFAVFRKYYHLGNAENIEMDGYIYKKRKRYCTRNLLTFRTRKECQEWIDKEREKPLNLGRWERKPEDKPFLAQINPDIFTVYRKFYSLYNFYSNGFVLTQRVWNRSQKVWKDSYVTKNRDVDTEYEQFLSLDTKPYDE